MAAIKEHSKSDKEIIRVKQGIFRDNLDPSVNNFKIFHTELCFYEGILLRGDKIVIPTQLRPEILKAVHEGHPGIVTMKHRLRTTVWWPKIDPDAEKMLKTCKGCTLVTGPNPPNPMKRRELSTQPWVAVAADFLGPPPSGEFLCVMVDYYSRYKEVKIIRDISAYNTILVKKEI